MLYISAQPAEYYFLWQLEIQLQNFEEMGILPQNIQVVLSYKEDQGIPLFFEEFTRHNTQAQFFFYPDQRVDPQYLSSIRPHILKQHFEKFPDLQTKTICYHDSDIIFRERLDEIALSKGDFWYFSDTRNYVAASYLKRFGNEFFKGLCKAVEIDPRLVEKNESYSGGAQHIMKGVTASYWEQVEEDAERIYTFIKDHNAKLERSQKQAQAWCADMWAVLWCAWKMNREVRLHDDLLFSWPKDHISRYDKLKIFHNSGVFVEDKKDYFCKLLFKESKPYDVDFSSIKQDYCSIKFVEKVQELALKQRKKIVQDCTLIIGFDEKSADSQQRITQYVYYLFKHLNISVHLVEQSHYSSFDVDSIRGKAKYLLYPKDNMEQYIKEKVKTAYFIYTDANILLSVENILRTIELLKSNQKTFVYPMNEVLEINQFQYGTFKDTLTIENWKRKNSTSIAPDKSLEFVEAYAMSKREFIKSGGNNLDWCFFYEDGFNLEKQARFRFLEYDIRKVNESAYKLFSKENKKTKDQKNSQEKYLQFCEGSQEDLKRGIASKKYSFRKNYGKKKSIEDISIGISSLKYTINIGSLKDELILNRKVNIQEMALQLSTSIHENFAKSVQFAESHKLDYIILLHEDIIIEHGENISVFWNALEQMQMYGLQILALINGGGFKEEIKLSNNLFWIDHLPQSSLTVIHKSLYDKILKHYFVKDKSIEQNLNMITNHIGTMLPNLGVPKPLYPNDEKYMVGYDDRVKYLQRFEDKLKWIAENT